MRSRGSLRKMLGKFTRKHEATKSSQRQESIRDAQNRMKSKTDLKELAARESEQVEWKKNVADIEDVIRTVTAFSSGSFTDLPVSWSARTENPEGQTSPEELLALLASHLDLHFPAGTRFGNRPDAPWPV